MGVSRGLGVLTLWSGPSWEANSCLANWEIPRFLCNLQLHCHVHKISALSLTLPPSYSVYFKSILILLHQQGLGLLLSSFPTKSHIHFLSLPHTVHLILLHLIVIIFIVHDYLRRLPQVLPDSSSGRSCDRPSSHRFAWFTSDVKQIPRWFPIS
jgi:hypothetical protein